MLADNAIFVVKKSYFASLKESLINLKTFRNNKRDTCKICWPFIELFSIAIRRCAIRTIGMSENLCSRHLVKQK